MKGRDTVEEDPLGEYLDGIRKAGTLLRDQKREGTGDGQKRKGEGVEDTRLRCQDSMLPRYMYF